MCRSWLWSCQMHDMRSVTPSSAWAAWDESKRGKRQQRGVSSFTVKNEKKRWQERKRSASSSANYLVHFCRQPLCFPHTSCYPSVCPCSPLCPAQLSSSLFLCLLSQLLLPSLSSSSSSCSLFITSLSMTTWQMMSESFWDICMRVSPSVCSVLPLVRVCICVRSVHSALCVECFFLRASIFLEKVEFLLRCICRGEQNHSRVHDALVSSETLKYTLKCKCRQKNIQIIWGPQPVYENVSSPRCLCTHEHVYLFSAYLYLCVCRPACAWIPFCVMRGGTSVSQWASLKAHQQRQALPTRVRSHVYACARLSLPNVLSCDQIQVHDSNITPLLLLSFCLSLFHTNSHFHLMLSTASSVFHPILASATFNLFLSLCNTHTQWTACS